ncbi:MAG: hypothetical protein K2X11_14480 [Acetobacteraceae bacterium]|nr:hypothetical protein [Acetobacteraceae bacterium]
MASPRLAVPTRLAARLMGLAEAERGRLALWLPVAMIAGVAAFFHPRAEPAAWIAWAALLPLPLALLVARRSLALA